MAASRPFGYCHLAGRLVTYLHWFYIGIAVFDLLYNSNHLLCLEKGHLDNNDDDPVRGDITSLHLLHDKGYTPWISFRQILLSIRIGHHQPDIFWFSDKAKSCVMNRLESKQLLSLLRKPEHRYEGEGGA